MECPTTPSTPPRTSAGGNLSHELSPSSTIRSATPVQATAAASTPKTTPIKLRLSSTVPYTTNHKYRIESRNEMGEEMKTYIVGPMPAQRFLDDFFPTEELPDLATVPSFVEDCYADAVSVAREPLSYAPFVNSTARFIPGFRPVVCSETSDRNPNNAFPFCIKPDLAVYRASTDPNVVTDSSLAELFMEVKWSYDDDPFENVHDVITRDQVTIKSIFHETTRGTDTLGQITSYAAAHLGSQFRTHVYSVLIVKDQARILRWDRSGAIVTEAIPYNKSPLLVEFFRRYSQAPPEMRGIDQSVSDPTLEEELAAREALQADNDIDTVSKVSKVSPAPLFKLGVPSNGGVRYFITNAPRSLFYTPPGRATRGFRAYDISEKTCFFLKDTWRIDLQDIQPEGLTYEKLQLAAVPNIPQCVAFGDILTTKYHATKTLAYVSEPWACHRNEGLFIPHRHYRLVLDVIGSPLSTFKSSYDMVAAVRDAVIAHKAAYNNAKVLHRDLSPGNIIIGPNGKGLLIDWDLSKPFGPGLPETPRRKTRTGTWQFMSGKLIAMEEAHGYRDDLESTIYILLWVTLMYSRSSDTPKVAMFMDSVLDPRVPVRIREATSIYSPKAEFLKGREFLKQVTFPGRPLLHELLTNLAKLFAVRYEELPVGDVERAKEMLKAHERQKDQESYKMLMTMPILEYYNRMEDLNDHDCTIKYFNNALAHRSKWPLEDCAEKQDIHKKAAVFIRTRITKTSWVTVHATQRIFDDGSIVEETNSGAMDVDGAAMDVDEAMDVDK